MQHKEIRVLSAASGGSALKRHCALEVGAAGDRITNLLSLGAGAAPGRQLSRWSACSKLSPPLKEAARALLRPLFFAAEEVFGKAGWVYPLCQAGGLCITVSQRKHADKDP